MSHLHTVNDPALLKLCLRTIQDGDALLLIEDGVYGTQQQHAEIIPAGTSVYALQNDIEARGLAGRIDAIVTPASDADFVRLCCEHEKIINWF